LFFSGSWRIHYTMKDEEKGGGGEEEEMGLGFEPETF
jgi:hypothetical protein